MSKRINTHCVKRKSWRRSVAYIIRLVVLLAHMQVVVDQVSIQIDQIIVSTAAAVDLLREQESWGATVAITFLRIIGRDRDNAGSDNGNNAGRCLCCHEHSHWSALETNSKTFNNDRKKIARHRKTVGRLRG